MYLTVVGLNGSVCLTFFVFIVLLFYTIIVDTFIVAVVIDYFPLVVRVILGFFLKFNDVHLNLPN